MAALFSISRFRVEIFSRDTIRDFLSPQAGMPAATFSILDIDTLVSHTGCRRLTTILPHRARAAIEMRDAKDALPCHHRQAYSFSATSI